MTEQKHFFVLHEITNKAGWDQMFEEMIKAVLDVSPDEGWEHPMWEGNKCGLTVCSANGKYALCVWGCPANMTLEDFQAFIDRFVPHAKNHTSQITMSIGGENLSFETFMEDMQKMGKEGHFLPYCGDGHLCFVRHHVLNRAKWDGLFANMFTKAKGTQNAHELSKNWHLPAGCECIYTASFTDNDGSFCLWNVPKDYEKADFQGMIDTFTDGASVNSLVWQADPKLSVNIHLLHPDFFAHAFVAAAETMEDHPSTVAVTAGMKTSGQSAVHAT